MSNSEETKMVEMLDEMRQLTIITGELSSIHLKNMQKWPYIVFDHVEEVAINYDLSKSRMLNKGVGLVEFHIKMPEEFNQIGVIDKFDDRCRNLVYWVYGMLWVEINVLIFINGQQRYSMEKPPLVPSKQDKFGDNNGFN